MTKLPSELRNLERTNEASVPLKVCGIFLDALFMHSEIIDYSPQKYNNLHCLTRSARTRRTLMRSTESMEVLHYAPDFTQGELISIIINIYKERLPQSYEFFRCHENSTAHQLKLFLTRAVNHPLTFVILGVNHLPINLQEVRTTTTTYIYIRSIFPLNYQGHTYLLNIYSYFLQLLLKQHMDFHSTSHYHENQPCIHYVETLPSVLQEMPWIQHEKHKVCIVCIIVSTNTTPLI